MVKRVLIMMSLTSSILFAPLTLPAYASNLPAFDAQQATEMLTSGGASVRGRAYVISKRGLLNQEKTYAKSRIISLFPMTPYLQAWYDRYKNDIFAGRFELNPATSTYSARVLADDEGRFQFRGLKPGRYLLFTEIPFTTTVRIRQDTGRTRSTVQVFSDWSAEVTTEPIYRSRKVKRDFTGMVHRIVEIKQDGTTVDLGEFDN